MGLRRVGSEGGTEEPSFFTLYTSTLLQFDTKDIYYFVIRILKLKLFCFVLFLKKID